MNTTSSATKKQPTFLKANGSYDTKINEPDAEYEGITWQGIAQLIQQPQNKPKLEASFIIPSTYKAHDGRSHEAQRINGEYHMLAIDIDDGNPDASAVIGSVESILGDVTMLIYSSSGATADNKKWRVLIPLAQPIDGDTYSECQLAFFALLEEEGIQPDYVLSRTGQVIYLPNVPPDKLDADGKPLFYESQIIRGNRFDVTSDNQIMRKAIHDKAERERIEAELAKEREKKRIDRERKLAENPNQISPIDEFNARHTVEDLFLRYGYDRLGSSAQWRSRYQSTKSYATKNFGDYWVSLSGSDVAAGVGNQKGNDKAAYCWGDAFTLFCHYEHNGDLEAAVRAYGQEINPSSAKTHDNPFEAIQPPEPEPQAQADAPEPESLLNTVFTPSQAQPILRSNYLIKGWLGKHQMSVVYGPSNVGKSFLCLDMAWCVAGNLSWQGCRVDGGPVLYLATEGGMTFHNRIYALAKLKYKDTDVPLYVRPSPVDLLRPSVSLPELGKLCKEIEAHAGQPLQMIVVDTLSRAMAGGNENGPEDMTAFIANVDALREFTKAHVMVVHHSGKDTAAGARGHSSLRAATDAEIELHMDADAGIRFAKATKQRDMETGAEFAFTLAVEKLGEDQDGDDVTTVTINKAEDDDIKDAKRKQPSKNAKIAIEAFRQLQGDGIGEMNPAGVGWPESGRYWIMELETLRTHFIGKLATTNKSSTWSDTVDWLQKHGYIHINDGKIGFITRDFRLSD